jgi:hypothetical protein
MTVDQIRRNLGMPNIISGFKGSEWCAEKTDKEQKVKVPNSEGIANQTGPESCVAHREVRYEALTGVPAGQPLSRESTLHQFRVPTLSLLAEGNTHRRDKASAWAALRGLRTWHVSTLFKRESGDLLLDRLSCFGAVRIGKARSRSR